MKALKYGMALILGLSLSVCGAQAFAQSSGQSQEVTPEHPNTLPEVPAVPADATLSGSGSTQTTYYESGGAERGIPTPANVESLMEQGKYAEAVSEFEKYIKSTKAEPCDLIFLPFTFYSRMAELDTANQASHQAKTEALVARYMAECGNTLEYYMLKSMDPNANPDSVVVWMTKAIDLDKENNMLYFDRATALMSLGRQKEACADLEKAAELGNKMAADNKQMYCFEEEEDTPAETPAR